jgi:hypothetical protein
VIRRRACITSPKEHHTAYGRIGDSGVGGIEIIGHDAATGQYRTWFFDSQGNASSPTLTYSDGDWIWDGPDARCTGGESSATVAGR